MYACVHEDAMAAYFYVALTWMDGLMAGVSYSRDDMC